MERDLQILLVALATIAGIGAYVALVREDPTAPRLAPVVSSSPGAVPSSAAALSAETSAARVGAGQCVEMRFLDDKGVLIPINPPFIGIMIGGAPLFEGSPPPFVRSEAGRFVPCPEALLASSRKSFDDFCSTDDRRKKAAADNGVDMSVIQKRCTDLSAALSK